MSPSDDSSSEPILMWFCARYLLQEEESGKALDSVANFHLQNVAVSQVNAI
ncbi:BnaA09g20520D [Brassica napus]|uniref:BnaA09g20520D protein n=2 Tax=Brassica TaxID=3705 RepID=A0A078FUI6_BRANA|nr:BnaA09g20520D [Brassica napus]